MCGVSNIAYAKADGLFVPDDAIPHEKHQEIPGFLVEFTSCDVYCNGETATRVVSAAVSAFYRQVTTILLSVGISARGQPQISSDRFYTYRVIQVSV